MKLLFDENFGRPLVLALKELLRFAPEKPTVAHILEIYGQGETDDVWVPKIAAEDWIVLSADRGKQCGGPKLPDLCRRFGLTHVLLGAALQQKKQFERARAVLAVWPELSKVPVSPKGSRYSLRMRADGFAATLVPIGAGPETSPAGSEAFPDL